MSGPSHSISSFSGTSSPSFQFGTIGSKFTLSGPAIEARDPALTSFVTLRALTTNAEATLPNDLTTNDNVHGNGYRALLQTQIPWSGGSFSAPGDAQSSVLVLRGSVPGGAPGETNELVFGFAGDQLFTLQNGQGYCVVMHAVAYGDIAGAPTCTSFRQMFAVRQDAGVITINAGVLEQVGDAGAATWSLTLAAAAGPTRLAFTFSSGATTANARCVCSVTFTEVTQP